MNEDEDTNWALIILIVALALFIILILTGAANIHDANWTGGLG